MTGDNALKACDLLPCPICRASPKLTVLDSGAADYSCSSGHPPEHLIRTYGVNEAEAREAWNTRSPVEDARGELVEAALKPFAAMGRVMETRARVTFGKVPADGDIVCESSGEAGLGILTMGHFRDAAALLPDAPGWGGMYEPPFDRAALKSLPSLLESPL